MKSDYQDQDNNVLGTCAEAQLELKNFQEKMETAERTNCTLKPIYVLNYMCVCGGGCVHVCVCMCACV